MDVKKEFLKIMSEQKVIALATSVNDVLWKNESKFFDNRCNFKYLLRGEICLIYSYIKDYTNQVLLS